MKKQSRSFITEIKRPRSAVSTNAPPHIVWPADPQEIRREAPSQAALSLVRAEPAAPAKQQRVLPDLGTPKRWKEPDAAESEPDAPASPRIVTRAPRAAVKPAPKAKVQPVKAVPEPVQAIAARPSRSKPASWNKRTIEDLPRGQRWKRHLPKSAW